jgi:hypothetical protein
LPAQPFVNMAILIQIENPLKPGQSRFALWDLGFRPFYLLASSFASLSVLLWSLQFSGLLPYAHLQGPIWHAHEMLFGFTLAVLTGFLLTAGQNWSGQPTPKGISPGRIGRLVDSWAGPGAPSVELAGSFGECGIPSGSCLFVRRSAIQGTQPAQLLFSWQFSC